MGRAVIILVFVLVIVLAWASGCTNAPSGGKTSGNFGSTPDEQTAVGFFKQKYGDPGGAGARRFVEPVVSTGIVNNLPVDSVTAFNRNAPRIFFWAYYDNFQKGDPFSFTWDCGGGQLADTVSLTAAGDFGFVTAELVPPEGGWRVGDCEITVSNMDGKARVTAPFKVQEGPTQSGAVPFRSPAVPTTPVTQPAGPGPTGADTGCPGGRTRCNGICQDLATDPLNCGACGVVCKVGESCSAGTCSSGTGTGTQGGPPGGSGTCAGGTMCGLLCVNLQVDPSNCGSCDTECADGTACFDGRCQATTCTGGEWMWSCSGKCVKLAGDFPPLHCGGCGKACPPGNVCAHGICQPFTCPPPTHLCKDYACCQAGNDDPCAELGGGTFCSWEPMTLPMICCGPNMRCVHGLCMPAG